MKTARNNKEEENKLSVDENVLKEKNWLLFPLHTVVGTKDGVLIPDVGCVCLIFNSWNSFV